MKAPDGGAASASLPAGPAAGLCGACTQARVVRSERGSTFLLCNRSREDPRYRKYPRLPVLRCPGFEVRRVAPGDE